MATDQSRCPSTVFDRFAAQRTQCGVDAGHPGIEHTDGCLIWTDDLSPHPVNRLATWLEEAGARVGCVLHTASWSIEQAAHTAATWMRSYGDPAALQPTDEE